MIRRHNLILFTVTSLVLAASPALAAINAYNNAVTRAHINDKAGDTQITGASAFADLGNKKDACTALANAVEDYDYALKNLDLAAAAPVATDDENRMTSATIQAERERITEKRERTAAIVNGACAQP